MDFKELTIIRSARPTDSGFILSSWLKGLRTHFPDLGSDEYFSTYRNPINHLYRTSKVIMACDPEEPDHIYGYLVYSMLGDIPVIHWAYVKVNLRSFGIFKRMLSEICPDYVSDPVVVSFIHRRAEFLKKKYQLVYKPELRGA